MKRKLLPWIAGICAAVLLSSCSVLDWIQSKPPKHPPTPLTELKSFKEVRQIWSASVGSSDNYIIEPALTGNAVFTAGASGKVTRLKLSDGETVWRTNVGKRITAGPGTDGNFVAVPCEKGFLTLLDAATGVVKWTKPIPTEALCSPLVMGGLAVVRTMDGKITAYSVSNGEQKWQVVFKAPPLMLRSSPGMIQAGPTVLAALPGGKLVSIMADSGALRFELPIGEGRGVNDLDKIADLSGSPSMYGTGACVAAYHGRIGCFNVVSGQPYWIKAFQSMVGTSVDTDNLYAVDHDDVIYGMHNLTGREVWKNDKLKYRFLSGPVSFRKYVVIGDSEGYVHFLSRFDGEMTARIKTDSSRISAQPLYAGDRVIVQTRSGGVYALTLD